MFITVKHFFLLQLLFFLLFSFFKSNIFSWYLQQLIMLELCMQPCLRFISENFVEIQVCVRKPKNELLVFQTRFYCYAMLCCACILCVITIVLLHIRTYCVNRYCNCIFILSIFHSRRRQPSSSCSLWHSHSQRKSQGQRKSTGYS